MSPNHLVRNCFKFSNLLIIIFFLPMMTFASNVNARNENQIITDNPIPRPGTPPSIPEPVKKETPDQKVQTYAEQAANFMANRVVETYGPVENYRFYFYQGFHRQANLYSNLGIAVESLPEYRSQLDSGYYQGEQEGLSAGRNDGKSQGYTMGRSEARTRFIKALDNPASLNITIGPEPNSANYAGLNSNKSNPDFSSSLSRYNNSILDDVRRQFGLNNEIDDDVINDIYGSYWSLTDYYSWNSYKYETLFSSWRADNAFSLFLNKKLVRQNSDPGKIQANNQMVAKYKEITNPDEFYDAEESRYQFKQTFISQYNSVIEQKWNREVYDRRNLNAESRGEYYFVQALRSYAGELGFARGHQQSFLSASQRGFQETFSPSYRASFDDTVRFHQSHAVLENIKIILKNQNGQSSAGILDSLYPTVTDVVNLGLIKGQVRVSLNGPGLNSLNLPTPINDQSMEIDGLARFQGETVLNSPSIVNTTNKANQPMTVQVKIYTGENSQAQTQNQSVLISWTQTLKQLSIEPNSNKEAMLIDYAIASLAAEWKSFGIFDGNPYEKTPSETLAGQYVQFVSSLPSANQQKFAVYAQKITAVYGRKPFLFSGKWKAVETLYRQIGYRMP